MNQSQNQQLKRKKDEKTRSILANFWLEEWLFIVFADCMSNCIYMLCLL